MSNSSAIIVDGDLYVCGDNSDKQLGLGPQSEDKLVNFTKVPFSYKVKSVSFGKNNMWVIDDKDILWACGNGRLGFTNPDQKFASKLTKVNFDGRVRSVSSGDNFSVLLDNLGDIWMCGKHPTRKNFPLTSSFKRLTRTGNFNSISCGSNHLVAIDKTDNLWALGKNNVGQCCIDKSQITRLNELSQVTSGFKFKIVECSEESTVAIDIFGEMYISGKNNIVRNGDADGNSLVKIVCGKSFMDLVVGSGYTILLDDNQNLYGYGEISNLLKNGQDGKKYSLTKIPHDDLFMKISGGASHIFAMSDFGTIYVIGSNEYGQLGLGEENRYIGNFDEFETVEDFDDFDVTKIKLFK